MYSPEINQMGELIQKRIKEYYYDEAVKYFPDFKLRTTDRPKFDELMKKYYKKDIEDIERFKSDLMQLGILYKLNEGQIERIYREAWDRGHDNGLNEILDCFCDAIQFYLQLKQMEEGIELLGGPKCQK